MSDDLDDLKRLMDEATPAPEARKKESDLALARKNFDALQGSGSSARLTSDRPARGLIRGVKSMFVQIGTRGVLTATTALVALGLVIALPQMDDMRGRFDRAPDLVSSSEGRATSPSDGQAAETEATLAERSPVQDAEDEHAAPRARQETDSAAPSMLDTPAAPPPAPARPLTDAMELGAANGATAQQALPKRRIGIEVPQDRAVPESSVARAPDPRIAVPPEASSEAFPAADPNPLKITAEEPVSTFSIDVDTASYAVIRSSLMRGQLPPKGAVRVEEMVNYFPYDYAAPEIGEAPFTPTVTVSPTPWNSGTELVHIAIQGREPAFEQRPPLNLVFLIDTSGSMNSPDKLPLLKQSLALMLPRLGDRDQIAIVAYAGSVGQILAPTPATDRATIMAALERLSAGGATAGQEGLQQAYATAENMAREGEVTRVILATDGDFNVGLSDPDALEEFIANKRESGTYLSVMGFGRGNLDDATMQALAQNGNGQAAYIDTLSEAQKVLVDQFSGALFPIADDVKIQVEFNPATVAEYRLIGYETRALAREDFNNDKVDAGDIGAGTSVTAIYEITPTGSPARLTDPLRYGASAPDRNAATELGYLKLRYKAPGEADSQLVEMPITQGMGTLTDDVRFASAIASFGELLRGSRFLQDWSFDNAIALASASRGEDPFGYRTEALRLMRLAKSLAH